MPSWGAQQVDPFPTDLVLVSGATMLQSAKDGCVAGGGRRGLYDCDTRVLSLHRILVDGREPELVTSALVDPCRSTTTLRCHRPGGTPDGPQLPQDAFEITVVRRVGVGMLEEIEIANHAMTAGALDLFIALDADFLEVFDLEPARHVRGTTRRAWIAGADGARTGEWRADHDDAHEGRTVHRAVRARVVASDVDVHGNERGIGARIALAPRGRASLRIAYEAFLRSTWRSPLVLGPRALDETERDRARVRFHEERARIEAPGNVLVDACEQAADDLFTLRVWELDPDDGGWFPAAGVPLYGGVFGRDVLTAGWQSSLVTSDIARGALSICARTQATRDDPFYDEEPGRMIHEMRSGPLSELGVIPQARYFGSQTTPAMFLVGLTELWHWTGDLDVLRKHRDAAERTLAWAERYGDVDGDGLLEYRRRTSFGPKNQGWKDSDEAIRYPDGRQVQNPIATVEENAFHCLALERAAEMAFALDEDARAEELLARAHAMRKRWHDAFWMPHEKMYAMALDAEKKQVASIGSNVGHALATGVVPPEHVRAVVDRLLAPDMFSGWGVRTLSSAHPSYNPLAYHLGSVWPVENATFALGCKRYGLDEEAETIATALLSAASFFDRCRLPEVLSGHSREERATPSIYPGSCSPQAWSASAAIQIVQVLLGLYAFAPFHLLVLVRPRLPAWLPAITLRDVRVGDARVTIRFERDAAGRTHHEVLALHGTLHVVHAAPPNDLHGGTVVDALKGFALEHAPGKRARALRLAMGALGDDPRDRATAP